MLSDKHARYSIRQVFITRSKNITTTTVNRIINLNNALKNLSDIPLLVKEAFKNQWNTIRDIKNYRDIETSSIRITCTTDVDWGSMNGIMVGTIEIFPDDNRIIVNVINEQSGEIRQGYIKF